jgi:MoxR-like ATPase
MDETKDSSKLLGQWVPAEGGGFRFVRAPALTMFEQGGVLVVEELNAITPGVAFTFHPMLDDLDVMVVDDLGIVATKHPDFWVVGTMNPSEDVGAAGTQQVNYALWDRFKCKLFYDYDTDIESKLVHGDERVLKARDKLRGAEGIRTEVTTRMLRDFWQNISIFGWQVAKLMFAANFPAEEREQVTEACKLIGG